MNKSRKSTSEEAEIIKIEKLKDSNIEYDKSIKVILLGDSNVGKSSIIDRLKTNTFNINQPATISLEHYNIMIKINSFILRMQIWDTAGQEKFDSITSTYYKSTDAIIFTYAINLRSSFDRILDWAKQVENNSTKIEDQIRFLVGNKTDLESERKVSYEEGKDMANKIGCTNFIEISCLEKRNSTNNNKIDSIIEVIGKKFYNLWKLAKSERLNSSSFNYVASESILINRQPKKKCGC